MISVRYLRAKGKQDITPLEEHRMRRAALSVGLAMGVLAFAAAVTESKAKDDKGTVVEIDGAGTYKFKERPFDPSAKEELKPDYRMLAVHFDGKNDVYHIKLTGPAKTLEQYKKGFDDWVKGFK